MANAVAVGGNSILSHKQRRAAFKKERRKRKRQALAKLRDSELPEEDRENHVSEDGDDGDSDDKEEERKAEEERQRLHLEWLERERIAQEEFRLKMEREEAAQKKKEEEEKRIREEWEEQQRREQEEREQKQQEKIDREEAVQKMLDQAESQLEHSGPWKNPEAPEDYGTEKDRANCPFFLKTGACRFGDRCSRKHVHPTSSSTLMVRGMFVTFSMEQSRRDDYDTDASLEYSEEEVHQQFLDFYQDVLPEFRSVGKVVQFKVSCNFEPHLRGNVYVQYETEQQCREAFITFNGRWYAGRQLQCEFSPVTRWKTAICGLYDRKKCPKGKHCNFLHVYRNPGGEFWEADRDLHLSPDRGGTFRGQYSECYSERRDWSQRHRSYSPEAVQGRRRGRRSRSRERRSRERRSRSRERRSRERRSRSREKRSRSRERRSRSRERRSRSRERRNRSWERRSRSQERRSRERRSRSREGRRQVSIQGKRSGYRERQRSRGRSRSPSRNRNGDRDGESKGRSRSPREVRERSSRRSQTPRGKGGSRSKEPANKRRRRSETNSPKRLDKTANASDSSPAHHHHKHSKKKKKKAKKKKSKSKRSKSPSSCLSGDSSKESAGEGEVNQSPSPESAENTQTCQGNLTPPVLDLHQDLPQETMQPQPQETTGTPAEAETQWVEANVEQKNPADPEH